MCPLVVPNFTRIGAKSRPCMGTVDFWSVSKFNTGSLPLCDILQVNIQTPNFRTYCRRALYDHPQTLHGDIARRDHRRSCQSFFDPTHSFSYSVHTKIGLNNRRAVLINTSVTCDANHAKFQMLMLIVRPIKAHKNSRNRSNGSPMRCDSLTKIGNFSYFVAEFPTTCTD